MSLELEVKILNIDVETTRRKIISLGGQYKESVFQQLYTYDLPSIYGRYKEIANHINKINNDKIKKIYFKKIELLLFEIDNLFVNHQNDFLIKNNFFQFSDILKLENWNAIIGSTEFDKIIRDYDINPKKWIRLRKTNEITTLAVKHILADNESSIQQLLETEIKVSSFEETNALLQQLGYVNKSYQEKKRMVFYYLGHEIDIDFWPGIPPYIEFEVSSEDDLVMLLAKLGYSVNDTVSCTADEIYRLYGKNMLEYDNLTF